MATIPAVEHAQAALPQRLTAGVPVACRAVYGPPHDRATCHTSPHDTGSHADKRQESGNWLTHTVRTRLQVTAERAAETTVRLIGEQIQHLREDAGLSRTAVAKEALIHPSHLRLIELGRREASIRVLARVTTALGADLSVRAFPNSGPPLRDRFQARMVEALLRILPPDWKSYPEVSVSRPVRGFIDLVISRAATGQIVAIEAQSEIRRLEQQLRWAADKSDALPTSALWPSLSRTGTRPAISRILLLRSTTSTRALARDFGDTLHAAYPAEPAAIHASLLDARRAWPGNGILWVNVDGTNASILSGHPRGLSRRIATTSRD